MFQKYTKDAFRVNHSITLTKIFSKHQWCFRKGFSTQHARLVMTEKMKNTRDSKEFCVAVPTDLSKAFDFIWDYHLLIAKLNGWGFD